MKDLKSETTKVEAKVDEPRPEPQEQKPKYKLGRKSRLHLLGIAPVLAFMVTELIKVTKHDFTVFEGLRTEDRQKELKAKGVSWTLKSKHLKGRAVDLVLWADGAPRWDKSDAIPEPEKVYKELAEQAKEIIKKHRLPIRWGYDLWGKDMAHWQLTNKETWDVSDILEPEEIADVISLAKR